MLRGEHLEAWDFRCLASGRVFPKVKPAQAFWFLDDDGEPTFQYQCDRRCARVHTVSQETIYSLMQADWSKGQRNGGE